MPTRTRINDGKNTQRQRRVRVLKNFYLSYRRIKEPAHVQRLIWLKKRVSEIPECLKHRLFKEEDQKVELSFLHKSEGVHGWMNINKKTKQETSEQRYIGRTSSLRQLMCNVFNINYCICWAGPPFRLYKSQSKSQDHYIPGHD